MAANLSQCQFKDLKLYKNHETQISLYKISIYKEPASIALIILGQIKDLTAQQET